MIGIRYATIVKAAGEIAARRGFHQASIRDIARAAGLSLAGLYPGADTYALAAEVSALFFHGFLALTAASSKEATP